MTSSVLVAVRIQAPPERVFAAFTEEIGLWWKPNGLFQLTPHGDGRLRFEPGEGGRLVSDFPNGRVHEVGRITVWRPPSLLIFRWRPASVPLAEATEVEARFEAVEGGTRVSVQHRAWDRVSLDNAARHGFPLQPFQMRAAEWWRDELDGLRQRLA